MERNVPETFILTTRGNKLRNRLLEKEALKLGKFTLSSGKENNYSDGREPPIKGTYLTAKVMLDMLKKMWNFFVSGPTIANPITVSIVEVSNRRQINLMAFYNQKSQKNM